MLRVLEPQTNLVSSVAWSPDGQMLASSNWDGACQLWDAKTGKLRRTLKGFGGFIHSVAWSPDGRMLAGGCADAVIRLWNTKTGKRVINLGSVDISV